VGLGGEKTPVVVVEDASLPRAVDPGQVVGFIVFIGGEVAGSRNGASKLLVSFRKTLDLENHSDSVSALTVNYSTDSI